MEQEHEDEFAEVEDVDEDVEQDIARDCNVTATQSAFSVCGNVAAR